MSKSADKSIATFPGHAKEVATELATAKAALAKADCAELFRCFENAVEQRGELLTAMAVLMDHYQANTRQPRYAPPNTDTVKSMETVALAALNLARDIALPGVRGKGAT